MQDHSILEQLPEAAIQSKDSQLLYANPMALHYLPHLKQGAPLPAELDVPAVESSGQGFFSVGQSSYVFRTTCTAQERTILFHPAPQAALSDLQLENALAQLRQFFGEFAVELGPYTVPQAPPLSETARIDFLKSYHRAFRLLNNLDFLRQSASSTGVSFRRTTLDFAGLCRTLCLTAGELLAENHITVRLTSCPDTLLIPGDPSLLQRLILGLIANSARTSKGRTIHLDLRTQRDRAILSLSDDGPPLTPRQLAAMLQQDSDQSLPLPGQGAGLGMSIARHIALLHQGMLLVEWGETSPVFRIVLPLGPIGPHLSVETPRLDSSAGLSAVLVELADVLPASCFAHQSLD